MKEDERGFHGFLINKLETSNSVGIYKVTVGDPDYERGNGVFAVKAFEVFILYGVS